MERRFYRQRLEAMGIEVVVPDEAARALVHDAIHGELVVGRFEPATKRAFLDAISELQSRGAQGVILGCTEIPLLVKQQDCDLPLFDTLSIHAEAAVEFALQ
jgi:aspartate racemase